MRLNLNVPRCMSSGFSVRKFKFSVCWCLLVGKKKYYALWCDFNVDLFVRACFHRMCSKPLSSKDREALHVLFKMYINDITSQGKDIAVNQNFLCSKKDFFWNICFFFWINSETGCFCVRILLSKHANFLVIFSLNTKIR